MKVQRPNQLIWRGGIIVRFTPCPPTATAGDRVVGVFLPTVLLDWVWADYDVYREAGSDQFDKFSTHVSF